MPEEARSKSDAIVTGKLVLLRPFREMDREIYLRWQRQGEWRLYDAPWEDNAGGEEARVKRMLHNRGASHPKRVMIATVKNQPLGWINHYGRRDNPLVRHVGVDICEDQYLNRGCGTEALRLWVKYLFTHSQVHKLCLDTWSFNPRMIRVAEKVGFVYEGCQCEMRLWQGEWLDLIHFGLLRAEWELNIRDRR